MNKSVIFSLLVIFGLPMGAQAQLYKCQQSDGSVRFQDSPCRPGVNSETISLAASNIISASDGEQSGSAGKLTNDGQPNSISLKARLQDSESRRKAEGIGAENARIDAYNKIQRCNYARSILGRLNEGGVLYRRDNAGERHYIEDKDRAREIAAAGRRVAMECTK